MLKQKNWSLDIGHWTLRKRGFSLVELVFAMFFLTVIIFGVISLQSSNLAMMNRQNNQIQAHFLANQGLQIVEAIGYSAVHTAYGGCGIPPDDPPPPCQKKLVRPADTYSFDGGVPEIITDSPFERTIEIEPTGFSDSYKITALIEWEDSTGEHRRIVDSEEVNAHVEAKRIIFQ